MQKKVCTERAGSTAGSTGRVLLLRMTSKNTNDAAAAEDTIITAGESKWTQQRRQIPYTAQVSLQAGIQDYHNNASLSLLHML